MSNPTLEGSNEVFTEVVNDLFKELSPLPHSLKTIFSLITNSNNLESPILAEIQHLSLSKLEFHQTATLLPVLTKMVKLTSLALPECQFSPDHFKFLFMECSALSNLESLDLHCVRELRSEDLLLLSQSPTITNLTSLNLHTCNTTVSRGVVTAQKRKGDGKGGGFAGFGSFGGDGIPSASGLIALLSSPVVKNLTHLDLGSAFTNPLVHTTIATSPHLSNLVSLGLFHSEMTPEAVAAFVASTTLHNLTHLNLAGNNLRDQSIRRLFSPPSLLAKKLQSLDLAHTRITVASLKLLPEVSPDLRELNLNWNDLLGSTGAAFIAAHMPNLTKLNLFGCRIGDEGYAALAASTTLTNLRELNLYDNQAQSTSIVALVNSPTLANLTHLNLEYTCLGPEVAIAIAKSPAMSELQYLKLSSNRVGDEGITALAQSTTLTNLTSLDLSSNRIGPNAVKALCTSPVVSQLTSLNLGGNEDLGNSVASVLSDPSSTLYSLLDLNLDRTGMDDDGVLQLLATPNLDQLNTLEAYDNTTKSSTEVVYQARFTGVLR